MRSFFFEDAAQALGALARRQTVADPQVGKLTGTGGGELLKFALRLLDELFGERSANLGLLFAALRFLDTVEQLLERGGGIGW